MKSLLAIKWLAKYYRATTKTQYEPLHIKLYTKNRRAWGFHGFYKVAVDFYYYATEILYMGQMHLSDSRSMEDVIHCIYILCTARR